MHLTVPLSMIIPVPPMKYEGFCEPAQDLVPGAGCPVPVPEIFRYMINGSGFNLLSSPGETNLVIVPLLVRFPLRPMYPSNEGFFIRSYPGTTRSASAEDEPATIQMEQVQSRAKIINIDILRDLMKIYLLMDYSVSDKYVRISTKIVLPGYNIWFLKTRE